MPPKQMLGLSLLCLDGVAKVEGLSKVMFNEMVEFPNDVLGIALNLEEDTVGCVLLGDTSSLKEGDEARTTGNFSPFLLGRVCWGELLMLLVVLLMTRVPSNQTSNFLLKELHPGSFQESQSTNLCKLALWL